MPVMETSDLTARQYWEQVKANPNRCKVWFWRQGGRYQYRSAACLYRYRYIQNRLPDKPASKSITSMRLSALARSKNMPVIWTHVAYMDNADDAGTWGTRTNTPDSLQNIKVGDPRAELDPRLQVDDTRDAIVNKRMASVFHDTLIPSSARLAQGRYRDPDRRQHIRLHPGQRRIRTVARVPDDRARRMRGG